MGNCRRARPKWLPQLKNRQERAFAMDTCITIHGAPTLHPSDASDESAHRFTVLTQHGRQLLLVGAQQQFQAVRDPGARRHRRVGCKGSTPARLLSDHLQRDACTARGGSRRGALQGSK